MPHVLPLSALVLAACGSRTPDAPSVGDPAPPASRAKETPLDVVLLVIDTCRADAATEAETPSLDALAANGLWVPQAWSAGTWTVPSIVSLFTGMPVRQHGWDLPTGRLGQYPPIPDAPMVSTVLHDAGFRTIGLYANPYLAEDLGFDKGFDSWRRIPDRAMPKVFAEDVAKHWTPDGRHFAYLHLIGPHSPLRPSPEARARWQVAETWFDSKGSFDIGVAKRNTRPGARDAYGKAYRAVIEDTDAIVGQLLDGLGEHRDHTLVVVTSDHGELLGEHDIAGHGRHVWQGLTHVPLVVDGPGTPAKLPATLSITDIPGLITSAVGLDHAWPSARGASSPLVAQREGRTAMLLDGRWRGVWDEDLPGPRYYDLMVDPEETSPLAADHGLDAARHAWESAVPLGASSAALITLDEQTREELQQLGYLE